MMHIDPLPLIPRGERQYTTTLWGNTSRPLNWVECQPALQAIDEEMHLEIGKVKARYARKFLVFYRALLRPYDLRHHRIQISAGMGATCLKINGRLLWDCGYQRHPTPLTRLLDEIEQSLDWDQVMDLDGEVIS